MQQILASINNSGFVESEILIDNLNMSDAVPILETFFNTSKAVSDFKFSLDDFNENGDKNWFFEYGESHLFTISDTTEEDTFDNSIRTYVNKRSLENELSK